jgi:polyphosphate glucokinase
VVSTQVEAPQWWLGRPAALRITVVTTMKILIVDAGGTHIKVLATGQKEHREVGSGPTMTVRDMVRAVKRLTADWQYAAVSIGYPGPVLHGRPVCEPRHLGGGWVGFDFPRAFGCPVKIVNDAAMQALGSYRGGRMLFLGLGTGLGSAFIVEGILEPMELAHLPYKKGRTYEDYVGLRGLKRLGKKKWRRHVADVADAPEGGAGSRGSRARRRQCQAVEEATAWGTTRGQRQCVHRRLPALGRYTPAPRESKVTADAEHCRVTPLPVHGFGGGN